MNFHGFSSVLLLAVALPLSSCSIFNTAGDPLAEGDAGSFLIRDYASFLAHKNYLTTSKSYQADEVFERTNSSNSSIVISISKQRAFLMNGDEVALDYPVSTGKAGHPTPAGSYTILEKIVDKRSNLYGQIFDVNGNLVNAGADSRKATIPPGGKYVGAPMPYWMRLTWSGVGMHVGNVPRYPASHACIRGQSKVVPLVFSKVDIGTAVSIIK